MSKNIIWYFYPNDWEERSDIHPIKLSAENLHFALDKFVESQYGDTHSWYLSNSDYADWIVDSNEYLNPNEMYISDAKNLIETRRYIGIEESEQIFEL